MVAIIARLIVSVLPVIVFLVALILLDGYKLVRFKSVATAIVFGLSAAALSYLISSFLLRRGWIGLDSCARYVSPPVEETLKASYMIWLMRTRRVGFMVDGAIYGFAIGAGFAIVENIYFLNTLSLSHMFLWIVRGFGTAIMHGGATALFGIIGTSLSERAESTTVRTAAPGFLVAVAIHAAYNHFFLSPVVSALVVVIALPIVMIIVFQRSERGLQRWLGVGFDSDAQLLEMITTGDIADTRIGRYLLSLKRRLPGEAVADVLCLIRLHVELALKAKGVLLMREAGFQVAPDPEVREKFEEMKYLEHSIGATGRLAVEPILHWRSRDLWQLYMLGRK
jgi:RsiW-degrading membrane proteinase PrsW (M82 family)